MSYGHLEARQEKMKARMQDVNNRKRAMNFHVGLGPDMKAHSHGHTPTEVPADAKVLRRKSIVWSRAQYRRATGPMVYIFWSYTTEGRKTALYVGKSRNGLVRALDMAHAAKPARDMATEFEFLVCASDEDAQAMERKLIAELRPAHNTVTYLS